MRRLLIATLIGCLSAVCASPREEPPPVQPESVVDASDEKRTHTPLHEAASEGELDRAKQLVAQGADVNARDEDAHTPLHMAAFSNRIEMAKFLLESGAELDPRCKSGDTPLYGAMERREFEMAEFLIRKGADVNVLPPPIPPTYPKDAKPGTVTIGGGGRRVSRTPLHLAVRRDKVALAALLIENGADVDAKGSDGRAPLHETSLDCAELLLDRGAGVNARDNNGRTPLHGTPASFTYLDQHKEAGAAGLRMAKLLIAKGAEVDAQDKNGDTPLHGAADAAHLELMELLIAHEADVMARGKEGDTPLHRGADYLTSMTILIREGVDVKARNDLGETPLHNAVRYYSDGVARVTYLLDRGAEVRAADKEGNTPLHDAARWCDVVVVELLIQKGADLNARAKDGATPMNRAVQHGKNEIVQLLKRHGGKRERSKVTVAAFEAEHRDAIGKRLMHIEGADAALFVAIDPRLLIIEGFVGSGAVELILKEKIDEVIVWRYEEQGGDALVAAFAGGRLVENTAAVQRSGTFRLVKEAVAILARDGADAESSRRIIEKLVEEFFKSDSDEEEDEASAKEWEQRRRGMVAWILDHARAKLKERQAAGVSSEGNS